MSGKGGKSKQKQAKKQSLGQNQSMTPSTPNKVQLSKDKSEAIDVETSPAASGSQSPMSAKQDEVVVVAEASKEIAAVADMDPQKTAKKLGSPVFGGGLPFVKERKVEQTETTDSCLFKPTTSKETIPSSHDKMEENISLTSSTPAESNNLEGEKDKVLDGAMKQSADKTLDHQDGKQSDDVRMIECENKESEQVMADQGMPTLNDPYFKVPKNLETKELPSKTDSTAHASIHGKSSNTPSDGGISDRRYRDPKPVYGTRQAAIMAERAKYLKMTSQEKRRFYGHKDIVTLEDIETWSDYYEDNLKQLKKVYPDANQIKSFLKTGIRQYDADDDLNNKVSIYIGDITKLEIDGIVNAANSSLMGGGGVDGAIHSAAGSQLQDECRTLSGCRTGDAKTTCGYRLPAKYIVHTVGPQGNYPNELHSCYNRCLEEMLKNRIRALAFCCISTGIYGYPNELAVHVALSTVREWLSTLKQKNQLNVIDRVIFCLFLEVDVKHYHKWMQAYFPIPGPKNVDKSAPAKAKDVVTAGDSDWPGKGVTDDEKLKAVGRDGATSPAKGGADEDQLKSLTSGETTCLAKDGGATAGFESATMDEDIIALDEDMEADNSTTGSKQVGGIVSPDKKCKLDPNVVGKMDMALE